MKDFIAAKYREINYHSKDFPFENLLTSDNNAKKMSKTALFDPNKAVGNSRFSIAEMPEIDSIF